MPLQIYEDRKTAEEHGSKVIDFVRESCSEKLSGWETRLVVTERVLEPSPLVP
jgi:hypothetical protein